MLKENINITSDTEKRLALLLLLITTCAENKDMEALDVVIQYVEIRHKNENPQTITKIIELICKAFNKGELTKRNKSF